MAYQANIPAANDRISDSQSDIQGNFQAIQALIDVDHYDFGSPFMGKHQWVTLPVQNASPPSGNPFQAGDVALYSFLNPTTNQNELYINKTNQTTITQIPATASFLSITNLPSQGTQGWTYMPSGIFMSWNTVSGSGLVTVTIPSALRPPNQILSVQLTSSNVSSTYVNTTARFVSYIDNTSFKVFFSLNGAAGSGQCNYLVIGY